MNRRFVLLTITFLVICPAAFLISYFPFSNLQYNAGDPIDSLNGVVVYFNGRVSNVSGRHVSKDGYNLGLRYQCVEFVKRYYYEHFNHKMPDSYGHAKDFFDTGITDGQKNKRRDLNQYSNPSISRPSAGDLLVFKASRTNPFGHVAIISAVRAEEVELIQQNPGLFGSARRRIALRQRQNTWTLMDSDILGWLRKE